MLPPPWRAFYFLSCIRPHRGRSGSLQQAFGGSMGKSPQREKWERKTERYYPAKRNESRCCEINPIRFLVLNGIEPQRFCSKSCNFFGCNQMQKVATLKPNAETERSFILHPKKGTLLYFWCALHPCVTPEKSYNINDFLVFSKRNAPICTLLRNKQTTQTSPPAK